jgi:tripartite-type tricarboxylate transporter receptor subunit TctC
VLTRRRLIALSAGSAVALSLSGRAAWVQMQSLDWPNRVVRFIVPFAAGGPTDIVARAVTEQLSKIWGQQVVIENRGGAGTNIGNEMVARSDPDGYTVLFATASLAVNRSLYRSLSYDPIADFAAVSLVSRFSLFMFVPNSLPTKSVMEFVAYAKAHPGKLTLASPGTGSTPHLAGVFVPTRTPPEIVRKISVDTIAALADPVVKSKLEQAGYMVMGSSPDELQTLLKSEVDKWSAVIKTVGIKIN